MTGWIRCSEQLPPTSVSVIVANDGDKRGRVAYMRDLTHYGPRAAKWMGSHGVTRDPDMWHPFPEVPTTEGTQ